MLRDPRSPLKDRPLGLPGQSVDERLDDLIQDRILAPSLIAVLLVILAAMEWWRYYGEVLPAPYLFTFIGVAGVAYAWIRIAKTLPELARLKQGRDGERVVGQYLERLREKGYWVFHDVIGDGFNVDHVLIGPAGIFTVETKTLSKPARGEAKIQFDGEILTIGGFAVDRDPIVQARAQAGWLGKVIAESTGKKMRTHPIVVFPGWFIEQKKDALRDIWVLEPKALPAFLDHEPAVLSDADVKLASFHLSRFIRTSPPTA
jgi:hypothetical protein